MTARNSPKNETVAERIRLGSTRLTPAEHKLSNALLANYPVAGLSSFLGGDGTVGTGPIPPGPLANPAPPLFMPTGGPYIGENAAVEIAKSRASGASTRELVALLKYKDIVAWTQSQTSTIDLGREVYLVVLAAPFQTRAGRFSPPTMCAWYAAVVDASTGQILALRCGPGAWPTSLPAGVTG